MVDGGDTAGERLVSQTRQEVVREAKRIEESLLYSSKGHHRASSLWGNFHLWLGIPMVLLSTIAGAAALAQFDPQHLVAGILSIVVAALSGVVTFLNPNEKASTHFEAGNDYDSLMNEI